jgi:hypothetical protein
VSSLLIQNNGGGGLERVKLIHPSGRFGMLVCQDVRNLRGGISADAFACGASKAISNRVVQKIVRIEMRAGGSMEAKRVPQLVT